jgi:hypothetical protein
MMHNPIIKNMKTSIDANNTTHTNYVSHFSIMGMQTQGYKNIKRTNSEL